jgi:hypothetical protein
VSEPFKPKNKHKISKAYDKNDDDDVDDDDDDFIQATSSKSNRRASYSGHRESNGYMINYAANQTKISMATAQLISSILPISSIKDKINSRFDTNNSQSESKKSKQLYDDFHDDDDGDDDDDDGDDDPLFNLNNRYVACHQLLSFEMVKQLFLNC